MEFVHKPWIYHQRLIYESISNLILYFQTSVALISVDGYGSLDRSFVRRARGSGGGRTRQSLLASEKDRERPASPSGLVTSSNLASTTSLGLAGSPQPPDHNRPR